MKPRSTLRGRAACFELALAGVAFAGLVLAACTGAAAHPPALGDCSGIDASCPAPVVSGGGGSSSGGDGGVVAGGCVVSPNDSQCTQCANATCCVPFAACADDVDCENLLNCEQNCGGASSCVASCEQSMPNGVSTLAALTACIASKCLVCNQSGVGDPCSPLDDRCNAGLACGGSWCTKACARSSDCAGLGAAAGNSLNLPNACVDQLSTGETCVPGCDVDADCASFPGTFCFATRAIEGTAVRVCAATPDAATD